MDGTARDGLPLVISRIYSKAVFLLAWQVALSQRTGHLRPYCLRLDRRGT